MDSDDQHQQQEQPKDHSIENLLNRRDSAAEDRRPPTFIITAQEEWIVNDEALARDLHFEQLETPLGADFIAAELEKNYTINIETPPENQCSASSPPKKTRLRDIPAGQQTNYKVVESEKSKEAAAAQQYPPFVFIKRKRQRLSSKFVPSTPPRPNPPSTTAEYKEWNDIIEKSVDDFIKTSGTSACAITFDSAHYNEDIFFKRVEEKKADLRLQLLTRHYIHFIQEKSEGSLKFKLNPLRRPTGEHRCRDKEFTEKFEFEKYKRPCVCLPTTCEIALESLIENTFKNFQSIIGKQFGIHEDPSIHIQTNFTHGDLDYHPLQKALVDLCYPEYFIVKFLKIEKSTITFKLYKGCRRYHVDYGRFQRCVFLSSDNLTQMIFSKFSMDY